MSENKGSSEDKKWQYCPGCGNKLPNVQNLKFCIKCGLDISYLREHKKISPYQTNITSQTAQPIRYGIEKFSIEELLKEKDKQLWGIGASIGIPILAFIIMSFLGASILLFISLSNLNLNYIEELASNTYFVVFSSLLELLFILFPVVYVGKYLIKPNTDDRLRLLGFTAKGYEKIEILKEMLIGLGFAFIGILLVFGVTLIMNIILFDSEVMPAGEVEAIGRH